jgi:predicted DNA-binding transcriptional regulator AlpA
MPMTASRDSAVLPDLVTTARIVQTFGITERTLANWLKAGTFPAPIRVGKRRYWYCNDVNEFIKNRSPSKGIGKTMTP